MQPAIRFDSQYFSDLEAALAQITDHSERLPALRSEWAARQPAAASAHWAAAAPGLPAGRLIGGAGDSGRASDGRAG